MERIDLEGLSRRQIKKSHFRRKPKRFGMRATGSEKDQSEEARQEAERAHPKE